VKKIFLWVLLGHLLFLFATIFSLPKRSKQSVPKKIVAKTVVLKPPTANYSVARASTAPSKPSDKKVAKRPMEKKTSPTKKMEKSSHGVKKETKIVHSAPTLSKAKEKILKPKNDHSAVKKSNPSPVLTRNASVFTDLEESIAEIEKKRDKLNKEAAREKMDHPSPKFSKATIDAPSVGEEAQTYAERLIAFLQATLQLPDYGEVTINLLLGHDGRVKKLTVMKAESLSNRHYLEKTIPTLQFPIQNHSSGDCALTLTFCNQFAGLP
jgi:hypothetical protein